MAPGSAPVASTTQAALISRVSTPSVSVAPRTRPSASISGATNRTGAAIVAPACNAARHNKASRTRRGSTASSPATSTKLPLGATQRAAATGRASLMTSACTPRRRSASWASGTRPSPQTLSRGKRWASTITTCRPACASSLAQALPAGPAPTTSTSQLSARDDSGWFQSVLRILSHSWRR